MINDLKHLPPAIDFGFGTTKTQATVGQPVTVWLQTLYNKEAYIFYLQCTGTVTKISDYQYRVTFSTPGEHTIQLAVTPKTKAAGLQSNILDLTVNP